MSASKAPASVSSLLLLLLLLLASMSLVMVGGLGGHGLVASAAKTTAEECAVYSDHPEAVNKTHRWLHPLYMHVPKCGSTFAMTLAQVHCPWLELNETKVEPHDIKINDVNGRCDKQMTRFMGGHDGVPQQEEKIRSGVTMLRDPLDRIASGFLHNLHDCGPLRDREATTMEEVIYPEEWWQRKAENVSLVLEYANCVKGMMTQMFNGVAKSHIPFKAPTFIEKVTAVKNLHKFAFVGIHEQWDRSICLYRAMYGGENMTPLVFAPDRVARYGVDLKGIIKKTLQQHGWVDDADSFLYHSALMRFDREASLFL